MNEISEIQFNSWAQMYFSADQHFHWGLSDVGPNHSWSFSNNKMNSFIYEKPVGQEYNMLIASVIEPI